MMRRRKKYLKNERKNISQKATGNKMQMEFFSIRFACFAKVLPSTTVGVHAYVCLRARVHLQCIKLTKKILTKTSAKQKNERPKTNIGFITHFTRAQLRKSKIVCSKGFG